MPAFAIDAYTSSLTKFGEEQCGDRCEILRDEKGLTAVIADGMGNGIQANLLATLTVRMLASMLRNTDRPDLAVRNLIRTIPVSAGGAGYAAFTAVKITENNFTYIATMGTPLPVLMRRGKPVEFKMNHQAAGCGRLSETMLTLRPADVLVAFSDGIVNAGDGKGLGWRHEQVRDYLGLAYKPDITPQKLTALLLNVCYSLSRGKPGDDATVMAFRVGRQAGDAGENHGL